MLTAASPKSHTRQCNLFPPRFFSFQYWISHSSIRYVRYPSHSSIRYASTGHRIAAYAKSVPDIAQAVAHQREHLAAPCNLSTGHRIAGA
eukprot:1444878-Rhodomonas_salina.1